MQEHMVFYRIHLKWSILVIMHKNVLILLILPTKKCFAESAFSSSENGFSGKFLTCFNINLEYKDYDKFVNTSTVVSEHGLS